jgi:hypothetical protein
MENSYKHMKKNVEQFVKSHTRLMKKHGVTMQFNLDTPGYPNPPLLCRIAFWILNRHNVTVKATVIPVKK